MRKAKGICWKPSTILGRPRLSHWQQEPSWRFTGSWQLHRELGLLLWAASLYFFPTLRKLLWLPHISLCTPINHTTVLLWWRYTYPTYSVTWGAIMVLITKTRMHWVSCHSRLKVFCEEERQGPPDGGSSIRGGTGCEPMICWGDVANSQLILVGIWAQEHDCRSKYQLWNLLAII